MNKKLLIIFIIFLSSLTTVGTAYAIPVIAGYFSYSKSIPNNNFSASTLFFSITDTIDNPLPSPYFNISDFKPGDSQTKTIRVKKGGIEDFKYNITFSKTGGDDNLCNALKVEAKLEGTTVYNGNLSTLTIDPNPTISSGGTDQWEITISLSDSSSELENKTCSFDLSFKGWQTTSDGTWGFMDRHSVGNSVATDPWELGSQSLDQVQSIQSSTPQLDGSGAEQNPDSLSVTPTPTPTVEPLPTPTPTSEPDQSPSPDSSPVPEVSGGG